jgi:hypothetical protein
LDILLLAPDCLLILIPVSSSVTDLVIRVSDIMTNLLVSHTYLLPGPARGVIGKATHAAQSIEKLIGNWRVEYKGLVIPALLP